MTRVLGLILFSLLLISCDDQPPATAPGTPAASPTDSPGPSPAPAPPTAPGSATETTPERGALPGPSDVNQAPAAEPTSRPSDDPKEALFLQFKTKKPATWQWQPPAGVMRAANWVVPAPGEGNQAHVIIFRGITGGAEANIQRWTSQFRTPDKYAVEPKISNLSASGMNIKLVELTGEQMRMGEQWYTKGQTMLAAIVQTPEGDLHIRLSGDTPTVESARADFMAFLENIAPLQ